MIDSCSIETNGLISIVQAIQKINESIEPISSSEWVVLKQALGRVLSKPVYSSLDIPADNNSAMDGYAFSSADRIQNQSFSLSLVGTSWAGTPYSGKLKKGECIRIFTGAVVPSEADSIIMQEQVEKSANNILFPASTKTKQHIRVAGGDIQKNQLLLSAQKQLTAVDIGLLASAGIYDVAVYRKLNIAFFSTGDELSPIGRSLKPGQIYDSNRYTLSSLLDNRNYNVTDLGVIADDKQQIKQTLLSATQSQDVIITTGGASVGDADYIKEILDECGEVGFWKIAIKPGKPLAFGKIKNCYFFGLPGNPVSVIATYHKIVAPALQQLSAMPVKNSIQLRAVCNSTLRKEKGRQEYQRGILTQRDSGEFVVESAGKQDSNIMSAMSKANCYIVLATDSEGVTAGEHVIVEPFDTLI